MFGEWVSAMMCLMVGVGKTYVILPLLILGLTNVIILMILDYHYFENEEGIK